MQSTKRHLTKRLEGLDLKLEEHNELGQQISNDVRENGFSFFLDN